jgi:Domain of Unknown Function (DUF1080)
MKFYRIAFVMAAVLSLIAVTNLNAARPTKETSTVPADARAAFLGRWDLTLKSADHEYPSWLELSEENGQLKAQLVGRWGNARALPKVELSNSQLTFVSPKEEEALPQDMVFEGTLSGATLSGTVTGPKDGPWHWTGRRAPALKAKNEKWGKAIPLFNGKDLTGWKMQGAGTTKWTVENGNLVSPGNGPELINDSKFEDFKLHVEFNCGPTSNSGVYLRGRYEVQIETDSADEPPSHHTGGIYGFLAPSPEPSRKSDEWQTLDITLSGRWITVAHNGKTIIDNKEIPGITGGALDSHEELPGPIYLQGGEKGHVLFRSVVITPTVK